jgi:tRNA dimethylallyltransferase
MDKVIVILGPTAVGKTKMSVELSKLLNGEVINADSTQIYKDLNIATAKITESEKEGIPHHLFDIRDKEEDYTVFDYQKDCRDIIDEITRRGKIPILVGGTGLYIKAALYNYEFKQQSIKNDYINYTDEQLYDKLISIDPNTNIHKNNRKRVVRALDFYEETGNVPGKEKSDKLLYDALFIGLTTDRDILYDRINKRVDIMVNHGLLDEAKWIYESGIRTKAITTPIGYKELFPYFDRIESLDRCLDEIKQSSRRYAKRQYTWFNNQMDVVWFNVDFNNFNNTINEVYNYIKKRN